MVVNHKTSVSEQDVLSPRKNPAKDLDAAESSQMALERETSERDEVLPCAATPAPREGDATDQEGERFPEDKKGMEPALHPQPWASIDPRDGSAITIVKSVDNQDGKFKSLEVICAEAVAKYKTCTTYTYETKDERSMGIFFSDEREASDPKPHPATRLPSLPPRPITPAQPDASPDDLAATDMRRGQALAVIYDTIQEGEWTKELKRAFKAIGLALGVDAYAAYPETFERPSARTRNEVAKGKADIHSGDIEGPVADKEVPAPAPPTEKARGKKRARNDGEADVAELEESSQGRRVRRKKDTAPPPAPPPTVPSTTPELYTAAPKPTPAVLEPSTAAPDPPTAQPGAGQITHEQAEPEPTGIRRSTRRKKPVEKAVKPLARATAPPPTKQRGKQAEAAVEQQPQQPPPQRRRVERERPVLMSKKRPGAPFERTVYYSDGE